MHPKDYCVRWIPELYGIQPSEWGYKAACIRELSKVTGAVEGTIKGWGADFNKHPGYVAIMLDYVNALREISTSAKILPPPDLDKNS